MTESTGLGPDVFAFYAELEQNQSRDWWLANKTRYDERVKNPVERLARFREICDDNRLVGDLEAAIDEAAERGFALVTTDALATAPRGFRADHPKIDLLRLKRLTIAAEHVPAEWMTGPELVDRVRAGWRVVREWNQWLAENLPAPVVGAR